MVAHERMKESLSPDASLVWISPSDKQGEDGRNLWFAVVQPEELERNRADLENSRVIDVLVIGSRQRTELLDEEFEKARAKLKRSSSYPTTPLPSRNKLKSYPDCIIFKITAVSFHGEKRGALAFLKPGHVQEAAYSKARDLLIETVNSLSTHTLNPVQIPAIPSGRVHTNGRVKISS